MNEKNAKQSQKPRTSKLAKASFACLLVFLGFIVSNIMLLLFFQNVYANPWVKIASAIVFFGSLLASPVLGIMALIKIKLSKKVLRGKGFAIPAITIPSFLIILVIVVMPQLGRVRKLGSRLVCGTVVKGLGTVFKLYAHENDDRLPTAQNWCDLFIIHAELDPSTFRCPESDAIEGESAYALNENVIGMKLSDIPGDVVLMFETSLGRTKQGRTGRVKSRQYFEPFVESHRPEESRQREIKKGEQKVYIHRWNQVGGPEILTTEYHKGIGCNVLFADGHAEFVKTKDLDALRWKP
jgi:prepilin-type processing-associated H-X9-DG protein